jgi:hypothetical protein
MLAKVPKNAVLGCRCQSCHYVNPIEAKELRRGFAEMRKRGWIAC